MSVPTRRILEPIFGKPMLRSANNGRALWTRVNNLGQWQKGTGWQANLYGGVQTGYDDWAAMFVPTSELRVSDFNAALWTYDMTAAQTFGVNVVIWAHHPNDFSKRVEITQRGNVAGLGKTLGWNSHTLDKTVAQFFWNGEDWSTGEAVALAGSDLTSGPGELYTWAQFQADVLFRDWHIYRVSLEYGWEASGTFDNVWVVELKLNGMQIPIKPETGRHKRAVLTAQTAVTGAVGANDVVCDSADPGHDWDFEFGGTGYITKAIIATPTDVTPKTTLYLFTAAPTGEIKHNEVNTSPLAADLPYYVGKIDFPALSNKGGQNQAVVTPSTIGNLPLAFDNHHLYGVLVDLDGVNWLTGIITIILSADMEDN